ncbi:hypothetical protein GCE9029_00672 [Grimontia celer]|uniref:DUF3592 domain-containing protein n=2 Tax=Grimontia celer TaxID=1796497 RepID=A0A128EU79_9GAMM|nr:hypothetical protein GCE9029_00672 [Grimontia celer]
MFYGCIFSKGWVQTSAILVEAEIDELEYYDMDRRRRISYAPKVNYQYQYLGKYYYSDRYSWTVNYDRAERYSAAKNLVWYHVNNKPIRVYVDPDFPQNAVIERGCKSWTLKMTFIAGLVLFIIGLTAVWMFVRMRKNK